MSRFACGLVRALRESPPVTVGLSWVGQTCSCNGICVSEPFVFSLQRSVVTTPVRELVSHNSFGSVTLSCEFVYPHFKSLFTGVTQYPG